MNGDLRRELTVEADPKAVMAALRVVERVVEWVPILSDVTEVEELARYRAVLADRMGPFTMNADLDIKVDFSHDRVHLEGKGSDRQLGARLAFAGDVVVTPSGDVGSAVALEGSYSVSGRAAALGASQITQKAEGIADTFAARLVEHFDTGTTSPGHHAIGDG